MVLDQVFNFYWNLGASEFQWNLGYLRSRSHLHIDGFNNFRFCTVFLYFTDRVQEKVSLEIIPEIKKNTSEDQAKGSADGFCDIENSTLVEHCAFDKFFFGMPQFGKELIRSI